MNIQVMDHNILPSELLNLGVTVRYYRNGKKHVEKWHHYSFERSNTPIFLQLFKRFLQLWSFSPILLVIVTKFMSINCEIF